MRQKWMFREDNLKGVIGRVFMKNKTVTVKRMKNLSVIFKKNWWKFINRQRKRQKLQNRNTKIWKILLFNLAHKSAHLLIRTIDCSLSTNEVGVSEKVEININLQVYSKVSIKIICLTSVCLNKWKLWSKQLPLIMSLRTPSQILQNKWWLFGLRSKWSIRR